MSDSSTPEERTEMPTEKRWEKIRNDAMLPLSMELNQVVVLVVSFLVLSADALRTGKQSSPTWIWMEQEIVP